MMQICQQIPLVQLIYVFPVVQFLKSDTKFELGNKRLEDTIDQSTNKYDL